MASRQKVVAVVGMLCEAFNRKVNDLTFEAYHLVLADVTDEQLSAAGSAFMRSNREFMPTAGQLRELARLGGQSVESRAEQAWQEFDTTVARVGGDASVTFADGLINATVRSLGGWIYCCDREGDAYHVWLRKSFIETYSRFVRDGASEEMRRGFSGRLSKANAKFTPEQLAEYNAYTGEEIEIGTSLPVLQGPTKQPERIAGRNGVPKLELKTLEAVK